MEAKIIFTEGMEIDTEVNGNNFIVDEEQTFPEDMEQVTVQYYDYVSDEDKDPELNDGEDEGEDEREKQLVEEKVLHNVSVQPTAGLDERFWFILNEESEYEKTIRELREENEMLEEAIAELAEIIGGDE